MAFLSKSLASVATMSLFSTLALSTLSAERNAAYLGAGFQWSRMETKEYLKQNNVVDYNTHYSSDMWGFNIRAGYKQFFGQSKRIGLRYYANFAYNAVGRMSGTGTLASVNYGAGMDFLWDFFVPKDNSYALGFFVGFQLIGNSWVGSVMNGGDGMNGRIVGKNDLVSGNCSVTLPAGQDTINTTAPGCLPKQLQGKNYHQSYFQLPINFGFRANFSDKQSLEFGALVPVIPMYYYQKSSGNDKVSLYYHRNASLYINYVFDF
ncbi:outer membrane protein [Helicobacter felis]|uniref:OMP433 n=1 Tax=Helicobacter felis TaxID=214 RepID=A0A1M4NGJ4_HELFE|nr:outer membrane protein [Helicobacter felis]SFZ71262.1 OMP433 [Helicobacter felis]